MQQDQQQARASDAGEWPRKHELLDVRVSETSYEDAAERILAAARARVPALVDHMSVHGLALASRDAAFRAVLNDFDLVAPDGQPVRWALNRLCGTRLAERVYGPELMLRLCARAAREGVGIYLYGGDSDTLARLRANLVAREPALRILGAEAPPFRALTADEHQAAAARIDASGAGLVFIGLGCPKQELFAHRHRRGIRAVQLCVGAAFDFHAGRKRMAPRWMQQRGLEWAFRLASEPRRLAGRYAVHNAIFARRIAAEVVRSRGRR